MSSFDKIQKLINAVDKYLNLNDFDSQLSNEDIILSFCGEAALALYSMPISSAIIERTFANLQRYITKDKAFLSSDSILARTLCMNNF